MQIELPAAAGYALNRLKDAGYEAVIIGGCVRDALLSKAPDDFDIATSATPQEIKAVFFADRTIDTGLRHGTVTLLVDEKPIEITTFRIDGAYTDARRPDSVQFTRTLAQDVARRDFTINAMAYDPDAGLIDLVNGEADLRAGIIRCVGDAQTRFSEDALRILRALRFAATLGFHLDAETERALRSLRGNLSRIAKERIYIEFRKLICGEKAGEILRKYRCVFAVFLPDVSQIDHHSYEGACRAVDALPQEAPIRMAAYFAPFQERMARDALRSLRVDRRTIARVATLVAALDVDIAQPVAQRRLIGKLGYALYDEALSIKAAYGECPSRIESLRAYAGHLKNENSCLTIGQLAVTGADLAPLGLEGAAIGNALNALLDAVIEGTIPNERARLLAQIVGDSARS